MELPKYSMSTKFNLFNPIKGATVTATDDEDGDITNKVKLKNSEVLTKLGKQTLIYEVIDSDGNTRQYKVNSSAIITIGDKNASINDLRVGFNVNMNASGDEIVSIEVSEIQSVINFTGRVILINEDEKFIKIHNTDKNSGSSVVDLEVTKNTKIFNLSGRTMRFDDIEEGQNIVVSAVTQGLEYTAVSIILQ